MFYLTLRASNSRSAFVTVLLVFLTLVACKGGEPEREPVGAQDPLWAEFIASHTAGVVSRKAQVKVIFTSDLIPAERVGQDASGLLGIEPKLNAGITFASAREVVIAPRTELDPGARYRVTLKPTGLNGVPQTLRPYEFSFQVKRPEFEVELGGLTVESQRDATMSVAGSVLTADSEQADKIEKLLSATYAGQGVSVRWEHSPNGQSHPFVIRGLKRSAQEQALTVRWNGAVIGASQSGERKVTVPARDAFLVTMVSASPTEGDRYIQVFFSDTLDPAQDFNGLVRLSQGSPTTRVDGNVLRVYTDQPADGDLALTLEPGIRNAQGDALAASSQHTVTFASTKPQVRFVGHGVILPDAQLLSVPFEAVNVRSVRVTAFRVYDDNLKQFLQVNALSGSYELGRVGRNVWRKTIPITAANKDRWNRYSLDVTELLKKNPGGLVRLTLSIDRQNSAFECAGQTAGAAETALADQESSDSAEESNWDYAEDYYGMTSDGSTWSDREDPCKDAYYRYGGQTKDSRNFLLSNIGMLAKRDQRGQWLVAVTDLRTAQPISNLTITALNFQNQTMTTAKTDSEGMAEFSLKSPPFSFIAEREGEKGYLKVQQGLALPVSHFDVGGEQVTAGIKGHIYGERGVWRPGDDIHLTFVLQDKDQTLPANHPVTMELMNPQGQLTQTEVNTTPVNGFYAFTLKTDESAPTGNWNARATLGGATFTKPLKIETVMPNRLKVALDLERNANDTLSSRPEGCEGSVCPGAPVVRGTLFSQWLSGATAAGLKADVKVKLTPAATRFNRGADFAFDDPARVFAAEPQDLFEGTLDTSGNASVEADIEGVDAAPGMLNASFTSRVFERGGAFSISRTNYTLSPYERYVGIKLPKGDASRDMLLTDTPHVVELATLTSEGQPTSVKRIEVTLYKIEWKWWWDKSGESLAQYAQSSHSSVVQQDVVSSANGQARWQFEIKYPAWGRYLVRACDTDGGHCTGQTFYIDWPMWAGRAQAQSGPAASVLVFTADKEKYQVGDTATLQLPQTKEGRALLTIENGTSILESRWIDMSRDSNRVTVPITQAMAPNVYASVTLVQPHGKDNDRPIRLYGVIPLHVSDPQTLIAPAVSAPVEWRPNTQATIEVSERNQRAMTYTVAVVDEGLLDLTSFKTPNLHEQFYKREALGVSSFDLFDEVAGAYSADLERLLALGGSDAGATNNPDERRTRFPPVVRYLGPFELKAGVKQRHTFDLPQYIGAVRVMVVGGYKGAYGSAERSVFVRQPLMLLPTLPRVMGPEEEVSVPVSVFVADPTIKQVSLRMEAQAPFDVVDGAATLAFNQPEEGLGVLRLSSRAMTGKGRVKFVATSGSHRAEAFIDLEVRSPNPPTTQFVRHTLEAGSAWQHMLTPHGLAGTNVVSLEVSAVPPLGLERRLHYLVTYPYGCLEQTTSAAFPQLYLPALMKLEDGRKREIQRNVQDAIHRLRGFQQPNGAFSYWPGGFLYPELRIRDAWSTSYAGHFVLEAKRVGYSVPELMLADWSRHQRSEAQSWNANDGGASTLDQAYRLYTLALARQPEIGAMNRLRERSDLPQPARWMLAAAYKLAGLTDAAEDVARRATTDVGSYAGRDLTLGSVLRDQAIALSALVTLNRMRDAQALADEVSRNLAGDEWYSTQSTAYGLMAVAHYVGLQEIGRYTFTQTVAGKQESVTADAPVHLSTLTNFPDRGATVKLQNTSNRRLFVTASVRGVPSAGKDEAGAEGLALAVRYLDETGAPTTVTQVPQGTDFMAEITVTNNTAQRIDNLALAHMLAAGWEIHNERMEGGTGEGERDDSNVQPTTPWTMPDGAAEHVDIRDDRINRYFSLKARERITFRTRLNAAYKGRYYLPSINVEAMYDAARYARTQGEWVEVVDSVR